MLYLVTYDLNKPGQDYQSLFAALQRLGAKRVLYSTWVLRSTQYSAKQIFDYLLTHIDAGDRLLVTPMGDWSSWNSMTDINTI
jgi:CRISPR/Cas system-associated endoribonuclease Cas2